MIESRQNEKIKKLFKLKQKKHRDNSNSFLVFGDHAVNEALKTGNIIEVYTSNEFKEGILICKKLMKSLSPQKSPSDIVAVVNKEKEQVYSKKILILDGVQDPGNVGTLIRSAVGFGFTTIISSNDTADYYNEKTVSATQGNLFYANLIKRDLKEELTKLKKDGYTLIVTDVNKGKVPRKLNKKQKVALILGSEGRGVSDEIIALADQFVKIKTNNIESLNVSMAGSIIMYEVSELND